MEGLDTLVQAGSLGGLGIFAWYAYKNNQEWRAYLTERNSKLEKAMDKQSAVIDKLTDTLHKL